MTRQNQPTLDTERLILRPFDLADALEVQRLAGDRRISATAENIPYPYEDGMAEAWINTHAEKWQKGEAVSYAMIEKATSSLVGCIGLVLQLRHRRASLGYWVAYDYWNSGYCTEAGLQILCFAFGYLQLNRVYAHHLFRNPASGQVMQKIGMRHEGSFPQHVWKDDLYEDIEQYGIVASDYGA